MSEPEHTVYIATYRCPKCGEFDVFYSNTDFLPNEHCGWCGRRVILLNVRHN